MMEYTLKLFFILVVIITSVFLNVSADEPRQIVLTWQNSPDTSMTITWRTDTPGFQTFVDYRMANEVTDQTHRAYARSFTFTETKAWIHTVELIGLTPATSYKVWIYHDESRAEPFTFHTAPDDTRDIVFLFGGDSRSNRDVRREINRLAVVQSPDFIMFAGDFIYDPVGEEAWDEWFDDWHELLITADGRRIPIIPAIGNHEVKGGYNGTKADAPFYYNRFVLPGMESYYALQYGPLLRIITLDSGHTTSVTGVQEEWLERTLQMSQHIPWVIVQYHVAAFPSSRDFNLPLQALIRNAWVPLFERYNVDVVCEAHDHAYKRTEPIRDGQIDQERGVVYVGDGGWGAPLREVIDPAEHWWLAEASSDYHFFKFTVTAEGNLLQGEPIFYNKRGAGGTPFSRGAGRVSYASMQAGRSLLFQNYPNPFNLETTIEFYLPSSTYGELIIYNVIGKRVTKPVANQFLAGKNIVTWNAAGFASGVYFYELRTDTEIMRNRMILLR